MERPADTPPFETLLAYKVNGLLYVTISFLNESFHILLFAQKSSGYWILWGGGGVDNSYIIRPFTLQVSLFV